MSGRRIGGRALLWAWVAGLCLAALALRIAAADGPLWIDELVSLGFGLGENGPNGVLTVHDNNHFLNTVWLAVLGPDAPPLAQRALSILLGVAAIPMAAAHMLRRGALAAAVAAAVLAFAVIFVVYGSEARGYAGLIFFSLVLLVAVDRYLIDGDASARWWGAGATVIGFGFHPLMVSAGVAAAAVTLIALIPRSRTMDEAMRRAVAFLWPSAVAGAVLLGLVTLQAVRTGIAFGNVVPFSPARFAEGYALVTFGVLGLPREAPLWLGPVLATLLATLAAWRPAARTDRALLLAGFLAAPLAFLAILPPNSEFPRYHMTLGLATVFALALAVRALWRSGRAGRMAACAVMALWSAAQAMQVRTFLEVGRGDVRDVLIAAAKGEPRPVRVASMMPAFAAFHLRDAERASAVAFELFESSEDCARPPTLLFDRSALRPATPTTTAEAALCGGTYELVAETRAYWLSGVGFSVFRRKTDRLLDSEKPAGPAAGSFKRAGRR